MKRKPTARPPKPVKDLRREVIAALSTRYWSGLNYDYDKDCSGCNTDDYHRNCHIVNFRISSIDVPSISASIRTGVKDPILGYCIDRLVTNAKLWDEDRWHPNVSMGYYGEELDSVDCGSSSLLGEQINKIWDLSSKAQIEFVLMNEYGFLIDRVKQANDFVIKRVSPGDLIYPNQDYSKRIDTDVVGSYAKAMANYDIPIGIYYEYKGKYFVIDGYHRTMAATLLYANDRTKMFDVIVQT